MEVPRARSRNLQSASSVSAFAVKLSGNFLYSSVSEGNEMVCRSFSPSPQISETFTLVPGVPRR